MDAIHLLLAYAAVAGTAAAIGWSVLLALTGRAPGPSFERFQAALMSLLIVGAASGLVLLAWGTRPGDGLHLVYAVVAIVLIPLARSFGGQAAGRHAALLLFAGLAVLGGVLYRPFTTG